AFRPVDYPVYDRVLGVQRLVLGHVFSPQVLARVQNNGLKAEKDEKPLLLAEGFRSLTDAVWSDLPGGATKEPKQQALSVVRRNLQREHLKELTKLVLGTQGAAAAPADARSLARMHLREIGKRIEAALHDGGPALEDTTRAHLEECQERI